MFWLVLDKIVNVDNVDSIHEYCASVAYDSSIHVYDISKHKYSSPLYDKIVRDGLIESVMSANQWRGE